MSLPAPPFISIIIPNHNNGKTIGLCLESALASPYDNFEVIVVDDCSTDNSQEIIEQYPCRFIRLPNHGGASKARNTGARNSRGDVLFFIDADCIMLSDSLSKAASAYSNNGPGVVIGGTYTWLPHDHDFFSTFQSIFIHYSETKNLNNPDYIATHAMIIDRDVFIENNGFNENFMPILEDVEFSHRLKRSGLTMRMEPGIQVTHVFNFTLAKSFRNGIRKSKYWSLYSLSNKDLLSDSGTASREFKFNVLSSFLSIACLALTILLQSAFAFILFLFVYTTNIYLNRKLIRAFWAVRGASFAISSLLYYSFVYPFAVGIGALSAIFSHYSKS